MNDLKPPADADAPHAGSVSVPLTDDAIAAAAAAVGLPIAPAALPGVRENLAVLAGHAEALLAVGDGPC